MRQADAILMSDLHIRDDAPVAWVGDYWRAQRNAIRTISELYTLHKHPSILIGGDFFDKPKPSLELVSWVMGNFPGDAADVFTTAGQHDLPNHSLSLLNKSALFLLSEANKLHLLLEGHCAAGGRGNFMVWGYGWGDKYVDKVHELPERNVALRHITAWHKNKPFPGCSMRSNASRLLKRMKEFDLIVTGDNHSPFVVEHKGRLLVNPGSLMRISADQKDFKPRVYLWYAEDNTVEPIYIPQEEKTVSRIHMSHKPQVSDELRSFIERIGSELEITANYEKNLKKFIRKHKPSKSVRQKVWEAVND